MCQISWINRKVILNKYSWCCMHYVRKKNISFCKGPKCLPQQNCCPKLHYSYIIILELGKRARNGDQEEDNWTQQWLCKCQMEMRLVTEKWQVKLVTHGEEAENYTYFNFKVNCLAQYLMNCTTSLYLRWSKLYSGTRCVYKYMVRPMAQLITFWW